MKIGHLFAGVGGGILADLILGHTPIFAVEMEKYRCDILRKIPNLHVIEGDIREWDPSQWAGRVDCISAGFPCQDISVAGPGKGLKGARSGLFYEVLRAVDAIRPRFIFLENSPAIRTRGRRTVIAELVARGYSYRDGIYRASHLGAPHRRDRWFLLASNAVQSRPSTETLKGTGREENKGGVACAVDGPIKTRSITDIMQRVQPQRPNNSETGKEVFNGAGNCNWVPVVPVLGGVVHGLPHWAHIKGAAIRGLGDAQIPIQAAYAMKDLMRP